MVHLHNKMDGMKKLIFRSRLLFAFLLITLCNSVGCKKSNSSPNSGNPGANEVWMQNSTFGPSSITVAVNTTIKWTNKDGTTHTVTGTGGLFNSGNIGSGGSYSHQFTIKGTYPYTCTIHSGMNGTVIVQ